MLDRVTERLGFPSLDHHRRFVAAIAIDAVGSGVFMPVSMLYFLVTTDLSLVQVGAAISVASAVALPAGPLIGGLVDRYGAKRLLLAGNLLQFVGFLAYLVTNGFAGLTLWTVVVAVGRTAFWGSYGNIVAAISQPGEREKWFGFLGALRNGEVSLDQATVVAALAPATPKMQSARLRAVAISQPTPLTMIITSTISWPTKNAWYSEPIFSRPQASRSDTLLWANWAY